MIKVLVADDDAAIRSLVSEVLTDEGFSVRVAVDGQEALQIFAEFDPDLVFTDQRMPGRSGLEVLAQVRALKPLTHVVIMTSYASLENAIAALKNGAYDYLLKPFEDLDLIACVARRASENVLLMRERERLLESLSAQNAELERLNAQLRDMALKDGLTGLFNHRYAQEAIAATVEQALQDGRAVSILFADVDHFKFYNDTYGHQKGDDVLRSIGDILKVSCRPGDLAARWGGEEFVVLLPDTDSRGAQAQAERLRAAVAAIRDPGQHTQPGGVLSVSIGVASLPQHADGAASLLYQADSALYEAKHAGRNTIRSAKDFYGVDNAPTTGVYRSIGRAAGRK
jgi:two-component system, cell cycle response regulator